MPTWDWSTDPNHMQSSFSITSLKEPNSSFKTRRTFPSSSSLRADMLVCRGVPIESNLGFCATQNSPLGFLSMLSGHPSSFAKTSLVWDLGPSSQNLKTLFAFVSVTKRKLPFLLNATPFAKNRCLSNTFTFFVFGSYLISLPVLSPLSIAIPNSLQTLTTFLISPCNITVIFKRN